MFLGGAPAARGCSIEGRKMMFLDRSSRCVGLLDRGEKGDVSGQELPLRGAAR